MNKKNIANSDYVSSAGTAATKFKPLLLGIPSVLTSIGYLEQSDIKKKIFLGRSWLWDVAVVQLERSSVANMKPCFLDLCGKLVD